MTTYELNLNRLCQSLRHIIASDGDVVIEKHAESFQQLITDINNSPTEISVDIEIAFRTMVDEIHKEKHTKIENTDVRSNNHFVFFLLLLDPNFYLYNRHRNYFSSYWSFLFILPTTTRQKLYPTVVCHFC